ncbi:lycopene beta cyclase [Synechococcus sp. CBW1107]|uniref:lycopene beta cyclase n=1 Tax=Synechococcus sp. CBW1107 TaxID=2789857 RepID=UPI002AD24EE0|nr:lycopene cyclase family protein [Synechococcus sp. CBW1107]
MTLPPAADVLVLGAGPAGLAIASELVPLGLRVMGLAAGDPASPWPNTYGIWAPELDQLHLSHLLEHRWSNCVSYFGADPVALSHDYGLFDRGKLQGHWLGRCSGMDWRQGLAAELSHDTQASQVTTREGEVLRARLVIDTTGHDPVFVRRPALGPVAAQAAYGIVGLFTADPVPPGQFVLMDYRSEHLSPEERQGPPTFLYAMDLGEGRFFVEETSLALAPPVPIEVLQDRLRRRLAHRGVAVLQVEHEERCLFPMNLPLPDFSQRVLGFGGAASLVHPASGYLVGSLLRRAPGLAAAIAAALARPDLSAAQVAETAWGALWTPELVRKHGIYQFGLEKLMRFSEQDLREFFSTFFALPERQWYGFLTNTLSLSELVAAMVRLFAQAPADVRWGLMQPKGREAQLLWRAVRG